MFDDSLKFLERIKVLSEQSDSQSTWLTGIVSVVFALALLFWIGKNMNIAGLLSWNQKRKDDVRNMLETFLSREKADTPTRRAVNERLETLVFLSSHKIYAEQPLRNALINLHEEAKGKLEWHQIRQAVRLLKVVDGKVTVPNWWHSAEAATILWGWFMQSTFTLLTFLCSYMLFSANQLSAGSRGGLLILILIGAWVALYANSTLWPFSTAKKIRRIVAELGETMKEQQAVVANSRGVAGKH